MTINTDVKVELSADQVECYIWKEMDAVGQAELLMWAGRRHYLDTADAEKQLFFVKEEFDCYGESVRKHTMDFLESLLGWLKGDKNEP